MSTLELEHLKHSSSSSNNLSVHSDGTLTLGNLTNLNVNGSVGVGTSSPANFGGTTLQVNHASSYSSVLATSGSYSMQFMASQNNGVMNMGARSNHHVSITTNDTPRMTIDTSGRVAMPNQPSFMVYGAWSYDSNYKWKGFATVDHNIGSHYDNATGRFTAPIAGRYMIYATNHHNTSSNYHLWAFLKNNSLAGGNWVQSYNAGAGYNTTSKQQVWNLAAGDYLEVVSNASYPNAYQSGYTAVGAYLIG